MRELKIFTFFKYLILGLLILFLSHFETLSIGPVKVSHLWKGAILIYLIIILLNKGRINSYVYGPLFGLAILQLLNFELVNNTLGAFVSFGIMLLLFLGGPYMLKFKTAQIEKALLFFSATFILSFVPYKLGFLSSIGDGYGLEGYGVESQGLIGPFQKVHAASTTLAGALIIIVYFWFESKFNKILLVALFLLGFYFLFYTYVRTGMLMFILGIIPIIYDFGKRSAISFSKVLLFGIVFFTLLSSWVFSNETLVRRITGERDYYNEESIETMGSGRFVYAVSSLQIYSEANIYEQLFGIGETQILSRMNEKIGRSLFPHNGFLFLLVGNGLIGLVLFLTFLRKVYKLQRHKKNNKAALLRATFIAYLTMVFFQSYDLIYMILFLFLSISLTRSYEIEEWENVVIKV